MATTRDKATAARVLRDAGHDVATIADLLQAAERTVYTWLKDTPPAAEGGALDDLEAMLATQELDAHGTFQAGVARTLAIRLDKVSISEKAQDALAMPQIAKELNAIVDRIMDVSSDDKEWLAGLLTAPGPCPKCGWSPGDEA